MKFNLSLAFLLISIIVFTHQIKVTVTCTKCSSIYNCKKITTDTGYEVTTVRTCQMDYRKVYTVVKCQQPRLLSFSNVCYMEQRSCLANRTAQSCTSIVSTNYTCGTCPYSHSLCPNKCWSLGFLNTECTNSCSQLNGVQQIEQACSGGVDSSGNKCACCLRSTLFNASILGAAIDSSNDLDDIQFQNWAKDHIVSTSGLGLDHIFAALPVFIFALFASSSF